MTPNDRRRVLLEEILRHAIERGHGPRTQAFRIQHESDRLLLDAMLQERLLSIDSGMYRLTLAGLQSLASKAARAELQGCDDLLGHLKNLYRQGHTGRWTNTQIAQLADESVKDVARWLSYLADLRLFGSLTTDPDTGFVAVVEPSELILDAEVPEIDVGRQSHALGDTSGRKAKIVKIEIQGYRAFRKLTADPKDLTVLIGANAAGKSTLFDFLRFISFAANNPLPPEIDPRSTGRMLFHAGAAERLRFALVIDLSQRKPVQYDVEIAGPIGSPRVTSERLATTEPLSANEKAPFIFLDFHAGRGVVRDQIQRKLTRPEWTVQPNELALRRALDPTLFTLSSLQAFVTSWRFYSGFDVSGSASVRRPAPTEPNPTLAEDGANLSAVLFWLMTEHGDVWSELETHLRSAIPGFRSIGVKAQGGPGTVIGVWREQGVNGELTLADLSDGTLRLLCWAVLCLSPTPPAVVCIDEPELGLHPRTLPIVAGLLRFASSQSQILVATHSPYFLSQFSLDEIAVMKKEEGQAIFTRPGTSKALRRELEEVGGEALVKLHITDELEVRS